jgi:hypothetical protein
VGRGEARVTPGPLSRITTKPDEIVLHAGEKLKLEVTGLDALGNPQPVEPEFSVDPEKLGQVRESVFRGGKTGSGRIIVRAGRSEATIPTKVDTGGLAAIEIRGPDAEIRAGESYRFYAIGYDESENQIPLETKWATTPRIGRIETDTGLFHAGKIGDGIIVAYSGGVKAYRKVSVRAGDFYSLFIIHNPVTVISDKTQKFSLEGIDIEENPISVSNSAAEWNVIGGVGKFTASGVFEAT